MGDTKSVVVRVPVDTYVEYVQAIKSYTNEQIMGYNEKVFLRAIVEETKRLKKEQEALK